MELSNTDFVINDRGNNMILKRFIQTIMENKAKFTLVWIVFSVIIALLALTVGIFKLEGVADVVPPEIEYIKGFGFWLPYHIANTGTTYWEEILGVSGFWFFSKFVQISPCYLFVLTIFYWMFLSYILTTVCYLPIIRRYSTNPEYSKTDFSP